jgi:hypothetical protein
MVYPDAFKESWTDESTDNGTGSKKVDLCQVNIPYKKMGSEG